MLRVRRQADSERKKEKQYTGIYGIGLRFMHTALLKSSKVGSLECDFGRQTIPLHDCEGVERVFVVVYSRMDLAINQWLRVLL